MPCHDLRADINNPSVFDIRAFIIEMLPYSTHVNNMKILAPLFHDDTRFVLNLILCCIYTIRGDIIEIYMSKETLTGTA